MKEGDVQRRLVKELRRHHWLVRVFSVPHRVKAQIRGWPDVVAIRWDHTWFLECKGPLGKISEGQIRFRNRLMEHSGPHVAHAFVWPWTELGPLVLWGQECRPQGMKYPPEAKRA